MRRIRSGALARVLARGALLLRREEGAEARNAPAVADHHHAAPRCPVAVAVLLLFGIATDAAMVATEQALEEEAETASFS